MEKGIFVKDILPGTEAEGIFLIREAAQSTARNGPYWNLVLADATGSIDAKAWHPLSQELGAINPGNLASVRSRCVLFRDKPQLVLDAFAQLEKEDAEQLDLALFLKSSPISSEIMLKELLSLSREEFQHPAWRKLVFAVLENDEIIAAFRICPAAKNVHQAYAGGLLEHTLGVFKLCMQISALYPELDRQTLLAGALFHDLGKIREFSGGLQNDYTDEGRLLGHLMLGVEMLTPFLTKSGISQDLQQHLKHLLLSHHGELEYGAVRKPQTAEALALHYADNLDAKLAQVREALDSFAPETSGWTAWQSTLGRQIFKALPTPELGAQFSKGRKNPPREECLSLLKV